MINCDFRCLHVENNTIYMGFFLCFWYLYAFFNDFFLSFRFWPNFRVSQVTPIHYIFCIRLTFWCIVVWRIRLVVHTRVLAALLGVLLVKRARRWSATRDAAHVRYALDARAYRAAVVTLRNKAVPSWITWPFLSTQGRDAPIVFIKNVQRTECIGCQRITSSKSQTSTVSSYKHASSTFKQMIDLIYFGHFMV